MARPKPAQNRSGGSYCSSCGKKHRGGCSAGDQAPPAKTTAAETEKAAREATERLREQRWDKR